MTDPMDAPRPGTIKRYVIVTPDGESPRYLDLLHGNFTRSPADERGRFLNALAGDARQISDTDLESMLRPGKLAGWRERLTTAWLIGLDKRIQFRRVISDLLLESELVYAGQGYCFALTRLGQPEDAATLTAYLEHYLPRPDCHYNQDWAIGGLLHLDDVLGTDHAGRFLAPGGLWSRSSFSHRDPAECHRMIASLMDFADQAMNAGR